MRTGKLTRGSQAIIIASEIALALRASRALSRLRKYHRVNASDHWIATDPNCARRVSALYGRGIPR
jgi:hypothetical protein